MSYVPSSPIYGIEVTYSLKFTDVTETLYFILTQSSVKKPRFKKQCWASNFDLVIYCD